MAARRIRRGLIIATIVMCALGGAPVAQGSQRPAKFLVGFDKEDITPPTLPFDYLGGEGYKRVGTSVVSPLYVRTLVITATGRSGEAKGPPIVISSVDSQGYFSGYQSGPGGSQLADYGYDQIRQAAGKAVGIPAANIMFSSTHDHTAPDTIGLWGGSPNGYFEQLRAAAIRSVERAIANRQPAWLRHGDADGTAYTYNPFPTNDQNPQSSDPHTWPLYGTLSVLEALRWGTTTPIVTLFDYGTHPDILEGSPLISPDWPAWVIDHVSSAYGGDAMFLAGVVGDEPKFPGGDNQPHTNAYLLSEAQTYAQEIDGVVDQAVAGAVPVTHGGVGASTQRVFDVAANPVLAADVMLDLPQEVQDQQHLGHILRAIVPPYEAGNVFGTWAGAMRIGDGVLFNTPGELYSDVFFSAHDQIHAGWYLVSGLADDQLGYMVMPADWPVVNAEDAGGRPLDIIGPTIGANVVRGLLRAAQTLRFGVHEQPQLLVADGDPVAAQLQECISSGNCTKSVP